MSLDEMLKEKGRTDWAALRAQPDHDGPEEFPVDWEKAVLVSAPNKQMVSLRLDADVLDFFKAQGRGYQTRMNAVLRAWMEAQRKGQVSGR